MAAPMPAGPGGAGGVESPASLAPMPAAKPLPAEKDPLRIPLEGKKREDAGRLILERVQSALNGLQDRHDLIRLWRDSYDASTFPTDWPWEGAANLNIPIVRSITDTIHARALRVMRGPEPYFKVTPFRGEDKEQASAIEDLLHWVATTELKYAESIDSVVLSALRDGNCFVKLPWQKSWRTEMDVAPLDNTLFDSLRAGGESEDTIQSLMQYQTDGIDGVPIEREVLAQDGPEMIEVSALDMIVYPHDSRSLETAQMMGHRFWAHEDDLLQGVIDGLYEKAQVDALLKRAERASRHDEDKGGDEDRHTDAGVETSMTYLDEDGYFECFELLTKWKVREDAPRAWCIFVVEASTGIVLRAIRYPYWHQQPCYINYCPYPKPGMLWGDSVSQILKDLSEEVNTIRNQRVNSGSLSMIPTFIAKKGAILDPGAKRLEPGGIIWVSSTDDSIQQLQTVVPTQNAFAEEAAAQQEAQRVTGASDAIQGVQPTRSRTLGETQLVVSEGNLKFDVLIFRLQSASASLASQVVALLRQYMGPEKEFAITRSGQFVFQTITKEDIRRNVFIRAHGNTLNSNPELEMQVAEKTFMMVERSPATKPSQLHAAMKNYLVKSGERNTQPYIGTDEEAAQRDEAAAGAPPPLPKMNISGKAGEVVALAMLLQANPGLAPFVEDAAAMLMPSMGVENPAQPVPEEMPQEQVPLESDPLPLPQEMMAALPEPPM